MSAFLSFHFPHWLTLNLTVSTSRRLHMALKQNTNSTHKQMNKKYAVAVSQRRSFVHMRWREVWSIDGWKVPNQEQWNFPYSLPKTRLKFWNYGVQVSTFLFFFLLATTVSPAAQKTNQNHGNTPAEPPTMLFCYKPPGKHVSLSAQAILQTQTKEKHWRWKQKAKGSILSVCLIKH